MTVGKEHIETGADVNDPLYIRQSEYHIINTILENINIDSQHS
jgi:hypothetical protein